MTASVVTNASMVAIFGAIMPEPFAMPPTVMTEEPIEKRTAHSFEKTSVVIIAVAASVFPFAESCVERARIPSVTLSIGRYWPITPVEETSICSFGI